jgi:hypothetical protein
MTYNNSSKHLTNLTEGPDASRLTPEERWFIREQAAEIKRLNDKLDKLIKEDGKRAASRLRQRQAALARWRSGMK